MKIKNTTPSRRKAIKSIVAGSGAVIASSASSEKWVKPVIESVLLPAHAQTSQIAAPTNTVSSYSGRWLDGIYPDKGGDIIDYDSMASDQGAPTGGPRVITFTIRLVIDTVDYGSAVVVTSVPDANWRNNIVNAANSLAPFSILSNPWALTYNPSWEMLLSISEELDDGAGGTVPGIVGAWAFQVTGGAVIDHIGLTDPTNAGTASSSFTIA